MAFSQRTIAPFRPPDGNTEGSLGGARKIEKPRGKPRGCEDLNQ